MNAATVLAPTHDDRPAVIGRLGLPPCPRVPTRLGAYDVDDDAGWDRELRFRRARNELRDPRDPAFEEDLAEPEEEPC